MSMNNIINSYSNNIVLPKNHNSLASYRHIRTSPAVNDVFFSGYNKTFKLSRAKSIKDIPKDANIFLFDSKNKLTIPPEQQIKECIITDKELGFWKKMTIGEEGNVMKLKNNTVEYAHGDITDKGRTCALIEADNSNIKQIEGVESINLRNNSNVDYIDNVGYLNAYDSNIGVANVEHGIHLNGNCNADKLNAKYSVTITPGDTVNKATGTWVACKGDINMPEKYSIIDKIEASEGAEITQAKVTGKAKTKDIIVDNAIANEIEADYALSFNNSVVENLKLANVNKMTDSKINKFDLRFANNGVRFENKVQINELNLHDDNSKLFFFPKTQWGEKTDNYIKKIIVGKEKDYYLFSDKPTLKIQGDINIGAIVFKDGTGKVEVVGPQKTEKPIKVINGYIKYDAPKEIPPTNEDFD